ncbi:porin family protein [Mariniflexile litorale]|uniref:Porin family protein n=1 Tax=Mariniflexile litorale TaxID=3045158 RepID=A0AAU7EE69_9FLAO|nr:porin family protein [Mariniflexile sp. KMM 9835]MDQ8213532.1 porin family protein [Mariniflexile sp. KMM 9835]
MKNIKLSILFTLLITFQLFSQDISTEKFKIGLNLGVNSFDLNHDDIFDRYDGMISYTFGLSFEYKLNRKLSLISNINYDSKMMKLENFQYRDFNENIDYSVKDKMKFNYINIPILIRYYVGNKLFADLGGFYNHSLKIENDSTIKETGEKITLWEHENVIKKYDYGISLGIGYGFDLNNNNHFSIELKDELGIANIANYPNTSLTDLKTNTIKLILNWELPI